MHRDGRAPSRSSRRARGRASASASDSTCRRPPAVGAPASPRTTIRSRPAVPSATRRSTNSASQTDACLRTRPRMCSQQRTPVGAEWTGTSITPNGRRRTRRRGTPGTWPSSSATRSPGLTPQPRRAPPHLRLPASNSPVVTSLAAAPEQRVRPDPARTAQHAGGQRRRAWTGLTRAGSRPRWPAAGRDWRFRQAHRRPCPA